MGRSYTPKYAFRTFDIMGRSLPMAWNYGKPTLSKVKKYFVAFNKSVLPGRVNAHLGKMATAKRIEVYRQSDKQIVASWPPLSNPPRLKKRYYKRAVKVARFLYNHFKTHGVPKWVLNKMSPNIRPMVTEILKSSGVAVVNNPPDKTSARELSLYIENDYPLYLREKLIHQNLLKKFQKGTFRKHMAAKLYSYLIDDGAKKYAKEFATPKDWNIIFPKRTRLRVAREFAYDFYKKAKRGEYM